MRVNAKTIASHHPDDDQGDGKDDEPNDRLRYPDLIVNRRAFSCLGLMRILASPVGAYPVGAVPCAHAAPCRRQYLSTRGSCRWIPYVQGSRTLL